MNDDFDLAELENLRAEHSLNADLPPDRGRQLGQVVAGSLSAGLDVRLDRDQRLEDLAVGRYVTIRSGGRIFFGMITDITLDSINPAFAKTPPDLSSELLRQVHLGTSTFGRLHVMPMLVLEEEVLEPQPVKSIPSHYAPVSTASPEEVGYVFGQEGKSLGPDGRQANFFHVGRPLDMEEVQITLNLDRLVERSSAVFGKSGTGKTYLSRLLLAGIIQRNIAVNLIFDMHNEYGWEGSAEHTHKVKGLKQLFNDRVVIVSLDEESTTRRGATPDAIMKIGYESIEPEDVEMLAGVLNLNEAQLGATFTMRRRLGSTWLKDFLDDEWLDNYGGYDPENGRDIHGLKALAEDLGQPQATLAALRRRFERIRRYSFITEGGKENSVDRILSYLDSGKNVVLEFGKHGNDLGAYLLVANFLTRRIHQRYVTRKEKAFGNKAEEPRPLVITIEEAHKFLEPSIAADTIFGTIARELRKYNVTLFIVDQRPSGIDSEVMSQVGTRVTLALDSEDDIRAVFMGVSGAQALRQVLATLDTREQALILGHAVPMPVVVQTRRYDGDFYAAMGYAEAEARQTRLEENTQDLYGHKPKRMV